MSGLYWLVVIKLVRWSAAIGLDAVSDWIGRRSGLVSRLCSLIDEPEPWIEA